MGDIAPKRFAPFFLFCGTFSLVALATRFDEVAVSLPDGVASGLLIAHFPLLLLQGYFESRLDYGESTVDLPMWMRIKSGPVRFGFTMAFTYLSVVVLQTWDIEIGPIDPTPPEQWDTAMRAQFFAMMSVGMFFPNYLASSSAMIPALRAIGSALHELPNAVAVLLIFAGGLGLGYGALYVTQSIVVDSALHSVNSTWEGINANPGVAIAIAFGSAVVVLLFGILRSDD